MDEIRGDAQPNVGTNVNVNPVPNQKRKVFIVLGIIVGVVLLVIAVWTILNALGKTSTGLIELIDNPEVDIEKAYIEGGDLYVQVQRNSKRENFTGMQFNISDGENYVIVKTSITLENKEEKIFVFSLSGLGFETVVKISVAPIYKIVADTGEFSDVVQETTDTKRVSGRGGGSSGGDSVVIVDGNGETSTCYNGIMDGDEIGVDCGGSCDACSAGTTYYVSNSGSDSNNGLSPLTPWKTISKVNGESFSPGDFILFKRGDTWEEELIVPSSGNSTDYIKFGAYGTGDKPVISGFTTLTGWVNEGGGIYSKSLTCESATNLVIIDSVNTPMGKYPNTGFLTYESYNDRLSITDNELIGAPDWTGAEAVIRKNSWVLDRNTITTHATDTLTITGGYPADPTNGYGYFIQNDIDTLDSFGEWYYDGADFYIYFGTKNPNNYVVGASTLNKVVSVNARDYIILDGLSVQGGNEETVDITDSDYINIQNCDIDFSGEIGIQTTDSKYTLIKDNIINNSNSNAISLLGSNGDYATVSNNTLDNTGLFGGMLGDFDDGGDGIVCKIKNVIIEYNTIENTGHSGMRFSYDNTTVRNNYINRFALTRNDAGGIYAYASTIVNHNSEITDNIVLNGIGASGGQGSTGSWNSWTIAGIYLDVHYTENFQITGNIVANNRDYGIFLQNVNDVTVDDNLVYNNGISQLQLNERNGWQNNRDLVITNNKFIAKELDARTYPQVTLWLAPFDDDGNQFGTANYNYYARPLDDNETIKYSYNGLWPYIDYTLAEWQAYSSQDSNSQKSQVTTTDVNDFLFEYNPTSANKIVSLDDSYIDVEGTEYSGSMTIEPYKSVVLIKNGVVSPTLPVFSSAEVGNIDNKSLIIIMSKTLDATSTPATSAFSVNDGSSNPVIGVIISGSTIDLTLTNAVDSGDSVTVAYTKPASNRLKDTSGNEADSFSAQSVTNNVVAESLGPELVTNGDFDSDISGWTWRTNWNWESDGAGGGRYRCIPGSDLPASRGNELIEGHTYKFVFTVGGMTAGTLTPKAGWGASGTPISADGIYEDELTCAGDSVIRFTPNTSFDGYIDDVSVREVL